MMKSKKKEKGVISLTVPFCDSFCAASVRKGIGS